MAQPLRVQFRSGGQQMLLAQLARVDNPGSVGLVAEHLVVFPRVILFPFDVILVQIGDIQIMIGVYAVIHLRVDGIIGKLVPHLSRGIVQHFVVVVRPFQGSPQALVEREAKFLARLPNLESLHARQPQCRSVRHDGILPVDVLIMRVGDLSLLVLHGVSVPFAVRPGGHGRKTPLLRAQGKRVFLLVVRSVTGGDLSRKRASGVPRDDVHHAAHGLRAVESGHRSFHDFHPLHVVDVHQIVVDVVARAFSGDTLPVNHEQDISSGGALVLQLRQSRAVGDAELQAGHLILQQALQVQGVQPLDVASGNHPRHHRHLLQGLRDAQARDHHFVQRIVARPQLEAIERVRAGRHRPLLRSVAREAHPQDAFLGCGQFEREVPVHVGTRADNRSLHPHGSPRQRSAVLVHDHAFHLELRGLVHHLFLVRQQRQGQPTQGHGYCQ